MTSPEEAMRLVEAGNGHLDAGRFAEAEAAYRAAAAAAPAWPVPWYDLGLLCKYQRRWEESCEFNRKATELAPDDGDSWWNLGIAATALGRWAEAGRAWRACGIDVPPSDGPQDRNCGSVPIRLDPHGAGEVVWAHRLDPARARIRSIPLPTSAFRWGDIVLHDGAVAGYRMRGEQQIPVFNVLA